MHCNSSLYSLTTNDFFFRLSVASVTDITNLPINMGILILFPTLSNEIRFCFYEKRKPIKPNVFVLLSYSFHNLCITTFKHF